MTDLQKLIDAVEKGENPPWLATFDIDAALNADAAYLGSLDAAKALHDALLPNRYWELCEWDGAWTCQIPMRTHRVSVTSEDTPARAWLLAILKACEAQQ